ncbi:MAG: host attachment protein [Sulfurovaceae bacterium]|nr:host attachment protein [Sulfurovaceae bacterium]
MKLENTIIIVADLGELKAYKVHENDGSISGEFKNSFRLEMIADENFIEGRKKMSDLVSDSSGRLKHYALEEKDKRVLKDIVHAIEEIVADKKPKQIFLAFPEEYNHHLMKKLEDNIKDLITKNLIHDLVKTDKSELLSHFID